MIFEVIERITNIFGRVATLSKERREEKDLALRAISTALDETCLYYRDLDSHGRDLNREAMIVKYWSAAAISIRHFDPTLAEICDHKSEYWINPENYDDGEIKQLGIDLISVRQAYRRMLVPRQIGRFDSR